MACQALLLAGTSGGVFQTFASIFVHPVGVSVPGDGAPVRLGLGIGMVQGYRPALLTHALEAGRYNSSTLPVSWRHAPGIPYPNRKGVIIWKTKRNYAGHAVKRTIAYWPIPEIRRAERRLIISSG